LSLSLAKFAELGKQGSSRELGSEQVQDDPFDKTLIRYPDLQGQNGDKTVARQITLDHEFQPVG
jgi:hypothetical protein